MPGYPHAHNARRALAMATFVDGTKCFICHRPMYKRQSLDLAHHVSFANGGTMDGAASLAHSFCNRSEAGKLGGAVRRSKSNSTRKRKPSKPKRKLPEW